MVTCCNVFSSRSRFSFDAEYLELRLARFADGRLIRNTLCSLELLLGSIL
jgi:hypothetical protein